MNEDNTQPAISPKRYPVIGVLVSLFGVTFLLAILLCVVVFAFNAPPSHFPREGRIEVRSGETLSQIAKTLKQEGVITSEKLFQLFAAIYNVGHSVYAGVYMFPEPLTTLDVLRALTSSEYLLPPVRITVPEGSTIADIEEIAGEALGLEPGELSRLNGTEEGDLFPDTYFVHADMSPEEFLALLKGNFREKLKPYEAQIAQSGFTEREVMILASILEKEANSEESMRMVSGILHNRLSIDMPLQVDATFAYLLGKESKDLTLEDLALDSPFNTYTNQGLPPTPIGNPGIVAIEAVLTPTKSDYFYYLSDADGNFHYAKTFDEHKANKARYLR